jgi:HSP20 family molecular chaperone IbpA
MRILGISTLAFLDKEMAMKPKRVTGPKGLDSLRTRPAKSASDIKGVKDSIGLHSLSTRSAQSVGDTTDVKDSKGTDNPDTSQDLREQLQKNLSSVLDNLRSSLSQAQSRMQTRADELQDAFGKATERANKSLKKAREKMEDLPETTQGSMVEGERQPVVDVFDEEDHVLAIIELPRVEQKHIYTEVTGNILTLSAAGGNRTYSSEVVLPQDVDANTIQSKYKHGVLEIRMSKK